MEPIDKNFIGKLEDKKFLANKADRSANTGKILDKLEEIKPTGEVKVTELPPDLMEKAADWTAAAQFVKALSSALSLKGEKGDKPVAGEDYVIPEDGKDYILTEADKKEIAKKVKVPVVEKVIETVIKEQPIVTNEIKEVAVADTAEQIAEKLATLKTTWLQVTAIKGFEEYMRTFGSSFLDQAKGFAPRALASLFDVDVRSIANGQAIIWDSTKQKFVPGASTGGGLTKLTATGTVDGSNTSYTFASKPTYVVSDGAWYVENSGWTWNAGTLTATMSVPPQTGIWGFN